MNTKTVNDIEKAIEAQATIAATSTDVKEVAAGLKLVQMGTKAISDDDKTTHEIALANKRFELEKKKQEASNDLEVKKYELDKKSKEDQLAIDERKLESQEKKDIAAQDLETKKYELDKKSKEDQLALDEKKLKSQEKKDTAAIELDKNRFNLEEKKLEEELKLQKESNNIQRLRMINEEKKLEEELQLQKESNDIQRLKLEIEKNSADTDSRLREMELSIHQKELDMNAERMKYEHKDRIFTGCLHVGSLLLSAVTIAMITVTNLANMNFERKEMGRTPTGIKDSIKSAFDVLKTLKH